MELGTLPLRPDDLPIALRPYWSGAAVTVIKCKTRSSVYRIEGREGPLFLKITPTGQMSREASMTAFLSGCGLGAKLLLYEQDERGDYLLTKGIPGDDATNPEFLAQPERLCDVFAESLSRLHRLPVSDCPQVNGLEQMMAMAESNYRQGRTEAGLLRYTGYTDHDDAYRELVSLGGLRRTDEPAVIHGDYCLPNVILSGFRFAGLIDASFGGIGDRHYDLFWGIWSLQFNLGTSAYTERFIDAYGRDRVDRDRLRLAGLLSVFNGFRGQDYYEWPE